MTSLYPFAGWRLALCFGLGLIVCWTLITLMLRQAAKGFGFARGRDFHHGAEPPIPRLGGVALAGGFIAVALAISYCPGMSFGKAGTLGLMIFTSLSMFGLGLWDDLHPLSAKVKFLGQIAIASVAYAGHLRIELFKEPLTGTVFDLGGLGYLVTVFWLVGLTNLINLIDGIDGLAGGIGLMLMLLLANLAAVNNLAFPMLISAGVAGALLGFLKFNYPPARIYMGDGGAYFLGFLIGELSIVNSDKGAVAAAMIAPTFALALPIVDVGLAMLRRATRGLPLFRADQKHIHHHLLTLGHSRERTLLNLYTVSLLCLFLALCLLCLQGRMLPLYTGLLILVLVIAGHRSGFTRDWYRLVGQLRESFRLRRETRYALTLSRWLSLEAERCKSLDDLWESFRFAAGKLGFRSVLLTLPSGVAHSWRSSHASLAIDDFRSTHELSDGTAVELCARHSEMSNLLFPLLGDLMAEAWYKAAACFRLHHEKATRRAKTSPLSHVVDLRKLAEKRPVTLAKLAKS
jgi:UDP-GlcNAc:undecaprenyl-phosphate GlcNAc-1-phosphate transferase